MSWARARIRGEDGRVIHIGAPPRHIRGSDIAGPCKDSLGRRLCRWCSKPVPKGRLTWCGQECIDEYLIRSSAAVARERVWRRDRGVCAGCGVNCGRIERIFDRLRTRAHAHHWEPNPCPNRQLHEARFMRAKAWLAEHFGIRIEQRFSYLPHLWEADHIVPVAEGGGACGLENLRTLCRRCHNGATLQLRRRLSRARRRQEPLPGLG